MAPQLATASSPVPQPEHAPAVLLLEVLLDEPSDRLVVLDEQERRSRSRPRWSSCHPRVALRPGSAWPGAFALRTTRTRIGGRSCADVADARRGRRTFVAGVTEIVTTVSSRSRIVIDPGAVAVITPRSSRKSLTSPAGRRRSPPRGSCAGRRSGRSAPRQREAALGEPEEGVQRDERR